ncbi:hypothetical protein D9M68_818510 [compost metagenome]
MDPVAVLIEVQWAVKGFTVQAQVLGRRVLEIHTNRGHRAGAQLTDAGQEERQRQLGILPARQDGGIDDLVGDGHQVAAQADFDFLHLAACNSIATDTMQNVFEAIHAAQCLAEHAEIRRA